MASPWMDYAGLVMPVLLGLCLLILFFLRDPMRGPTRRVSHSIWCTRYRRRAEVIFLEGTGPNGLMRLVQECPLRGRRERCGESCALGGPQSRWRIRLARPAQAGAPL